MWTSEYNSYEPMKIKCEKYLQNHIINRSLVNIYFF